MKYTLVTRPIEDALSTVDALEQLGLNVFLEPMLDVIFIERFTPELKRALTENPIGIIFSSSNAIRAFQKMAGTKLPQDIPVFTMGTSSKILAQHLGFKQVFSSEGIAETLIEQIESALEPMSGFILYPSGAVLSTDFAALLKKKYYQVVRVITYETKAPVGLSLKLKILLQDKQISSALFYSPRTAEIFMRLTAQAGLTDSLKNVRGYCLSDRVKYKLNATFKELKVAKTPEQKHLLDLIAQDISATIRTK